ncbi:MAG: MarR family transcriptional regulator [Phycisphaerales bacterium]|nr:MarR family transcriptional regulator [Phycisphaerales bacterium]
MSAPRTHQSAAKAQSGRGLASGAAAPPQAQWTFLSNHAHVLVVLARAPDTRLRDVAARVGITERAVQRIVAELVAGGVLRRMRIGRCNHYEVRRAAPLRHPLEHHCRVGDLLDMVLAR